MDLFKNKRGKYDGSRRMEKEELRFGGGAYKTSNMTASRRRISA